MFSLTSQYALVTGATRGIGQAIAIQLAKQGAYVTGTATTPEGAERFSRQMMELNLKGQGLPLDLSDPTSIKKCAAVLRESHQSPTILINNAGIIQDHSTLRLSLKDWQKVIEINLNGAFYLTQQCLPSMLKQRYGRIINISSAVALTGNPGQANYAAAKAGLIGFSKTLALEVAAKGITVNVIAPGLIQTDMTKNLSKEQYTQFLKRVPLKRVGTPDDVSAACIFLASKESCYITGHTLHINGGLWME